MVHINTMRMSVTLTGPQASFLKKESRRLGISVADVIRRIVDQHREKFEENSQQGHR